MPVADNQIMNMAADRVTSIHLYLAPGVDSSFTMYDDDGCTEDYRQGVYKKTHITMSGDSTVQVDFRYEGSYENTVEQMLIEMIAKKQGPMLVEAVSSDGKETARLQQFFNRNLFDEAAAGWYYCLSTRSVLIKDPVPKKDYSVRVSYKKRDLVNM